MQFYNLLPFNYIIKLIYTGTGTLISTLTSTIKVNTNNYKFMSEQMLKCWVKTFN